MNGLRALMTCEAVSCRAREPDDQSEGDGMGEAAMKITITTEPWRHEIEVREHSAGCANEELESSRRPRHDRAAHSESNHHVRWCRHLRSSTHSPIVS